MLVGVLALSFPQSTTFAVNNVSSWIEAVNGVRSGGDNKEYTITVTGNISMPPSTENTFGSVTGITITIEGNGSISPSNNGVLLIIGKGQTIVVRDVTLRGRSGNASYSVVAVMNGGIFRMESNASVTGNTIDGGGGGVWVEGGTFIMKDNASVRGNIVSRDGGGGVYVKGGAFSMEGNSTVIDNKFNGRSERIGGGGVYVASGTFTMKDSASVQNNSIINNIGSTGYFTARSNGGGVYNSGTFIMQDSASVTGNTNNCIDGYGQGGGVYSGGTFTMQGNASVKGNISNSNYSGYTGGAGGGGVCSEGTFTMQDNTSVSGNNASFNGGGVWVGGGTFIMQKNASVSDNTCSNNDSSGGGGIFVYSGTFTIQDNALVSGNTANSGGGVYVNVDSLYNRRGTYIMQGNASVSSNKASSNGGGVYISGTFTMQEDALISGNTATYYGGGVYNNGTFTKKGGTIYGDDADQSLKNTVISRFGNAMYESKNSGWRNATAGTTMNSDSYGFWLNDGDVVRFPFTGTVSVSTWKRSNFNNTLILTHNTMKSSSSNNLWILQSISGNVYTFRRSNAANTLTITIRLENNNLVISGDSGSGQDNWNGTWAKR